METLNFKQFYKELGKLLYAVAAMDNKIQKEEVDALHKFVSKELALSEVDSDSSGMNIAFYTDFEFDDYANQHVSMKDAYTSFIKFIQENRERIDPLLIDKSINAVENISSSLRKATPEEKKIIDKIKREIRQAID